MNLENEDFDFLSYIASSENNPPALSRQIRWNSSKPIEISEIFISSITSTENQGEIELSDFFDKNDVLVIQSFDNKELCQRWSISEVANNPKEKYFSLKVLWSSSDYSGFGEFEDGTQLLIHVEEALEGEALEVIEAPEVPVQLAPSIHEETEIKETAMAEHRVEESKVEPEKPSLEELIAKREDLEKRKLENDELIGSWEASAQQLLAWYDRHTHSFLWKTLDSMQSNLKEATAKLATYTEIVEKLAVPNPGTMIELRKKFHKKLLVLTSGIVLVATILLILPTLTGLSFINNYLSQYFVRVANPLRTVVMYSLLALFIFIIGALISYYRGWANFERKVRTTLWELQTVSSGVDHVRNEEMRLRSLYPQVKEWLEILGNALANPWKIRDEWLLAENKTLKSEELPYSLRLAQPIEEDTAADIAMQREAAERFMVRGWRAKVFSDQVDVIRQVVGMSEERLNVDQIDKDISYSPNGPRALVYRYIKDQEVLEKVGRRQLLPLIAEVQQNAISQTRPPVKEVRQSALGVSKTARNILEDEKKTGWDEFLSLSAPVKGRTRTPLSVLGLSDEGKLKNYQDNYETFMILPHRLHHLVEHLEPANVETYEESSKLPMDIAVRTDFTGPISRDHLLFLAKTKEELEKQKSQVEARIKEEIKNRKSGID